MRYLLALLCAFVLPFSASAQSQSITLGSIAFVRVAPPAGWMPLEIPRNKVMFTHVPFGSPETKEFVMVFACSYDEGGCPLCGEKVNPIKRWYGDRAPDDPAAVITRPDGRQVYRQAGKGLIHKEGFTAVDAVCDELGVAIFTAWTQDGGAPAALQFLGEVENTIQWIYP